VTTLTDTSDCSQRFLETTAGQHNFSGTAAKRQMTGSVSEITKLGFHAQKNAQLLQLPQNNLVKVKTRLFEPGNCHLMKENFG